MAAQARQKSLRVAPTAAMRPKSLMKRLAEAERERSEAEKKRMVQK